MTKTNINTSNKNNTTKINKNDNNKNNNHKAVTRIKNWSNYNAGMVDRGHFHKLAKLAVSEIKKEINSRAFQQHKTAGRPKKYPDALILIIAVFREIFGMSFREAEGFAKDVFEEFGIDVPDYTTTQRRMGKLKIDLRLDKRRLKGNLYIMADSTGYKILGEGEWKTYKHGRTKKRIWTKVHYAVDYASQQIVGLTITIHTRGDNLEAENLLKETKRNLGNKSSSIVAVLGDGAYNTKALKKYVEAECGAKLISPPRIKPKMTKLEEMQIRQTGKTIYIGANKADNERCYIVGRDQWKHEVGYHKRSLVETHMFREKSPFGDKLRCRTKENQIAEITIRAMILNIWTNEWMPKYTKPTPRSKTKP